MKYSFFGSVMGVLFLLSSVNAYTVSGVVKSNEGIAVPGAKVLLLKRGMYAMTGVNGEFTLHEEDTPDAIHSYSAPGFLSIKGSVLSYSQSGSDRVQIQILDLMGNQILSTVLSGSGSVNLEGFVNASGTYFAKVKVGNAIQSFKFSASGKHINIYSGARGKAVLKKIGETDDLRVTASGYDTLNVPLSNLDTTLNLTLNKTKVTPEFSFGCGLKNAPVPTRGCGEDLKLKKTVNFDWNWSKGKRNIKIDIPDNYDKNKPYRLVFGMHCMGGWAGGVQQEGYYGIKPLDTEKSTIFVAPEGNGNHAPWAQDDYTLFDELLNMLEGDLCIDSSRVFSSGFSYGSMFPNGLSRNHQAGLRAVAVYETADVNIWLPDPKDLPIAWMGVHGLSDGLCTPAMGRRARNLALKHNSAAGKDATKETAQEYTGGNHVCYNYKDVDTRFPVRWCTDNAGHIWDHKDPGQSQTWVPATTWDFFTQF